MPNAPTMDNPFDRAAVRRVLSRVPPNAINHRAEIAEECTRFMEIVYAHYGEEGVQRFVAIVREEASAMARENTEKAVRLQSQAARKASGGAFAVLLLLFVLGVLLGIVLRG